MKKLDSIKRFRHQTWLVLAALALLLVPQCLWAATLRAVDPATGSAMTGADPGKWAQVRVLLDLEQDEQVNQAGFVVCITPQDGAPVILGDWLADLAKDPNTPRPELVNFEAMVRPLPAVTVFPPEGLTGREQQLYKQPCEISVRWQGPDYIFNRRIGPATITLGYLNIKVPATARPGQTYAIELLDATAALDDQPVPVDIGPAARLGIFTRLSVSGEGNGWVRVDRETQDLPYRAKYLPGDQVQLVAIPDDGWYFTGWSGDVDSDYDLLDVVMDGNKEITAHFSTTHPSVVIIPNPGDVIPTIITVRLARVGHQHVTESENLRFKLRIYGTEDSRTHYSSSHLPHGARLDPFSGEFSWRPDYGQAGSYRISFTAELEAASDTEDVTIQVTPGNHPPVLAHIGDKTVRVGETLTFTIHATDYEGDPLTYAASNLPPGATFSGQTFSWTPSTDQAGQDRHVTFSVRDRMHTVSDTIHIHVQKLHPANRPPVLHISGPNRVKQGQSVHIHFRAYDPDGDSLTFSTGGLPSGASCHYGATDGSIDWTPPEGARGAVSFTINVSDGHGGSDSGTITVMVDNPSGGGGDKPNDPGDEKHRGLGGDRDKPATGDTKQKKDKEPSQNDNRGHRPGKEPAANNNNQHNANRNIDNRQEEEARAEITKQEKKRHQEETQLTAEIKQREEEEAHRIKKSIAEEKQRAEISKQQGDKRQEEALREERSKQEEKERALESQREQARQREELRLQEQRKRDEERQREEIKKRDAERQKQEERLKEEQRKRDEIQKQEDEKKREELKQQEEERKQQEQRLQDEQRKRDEERKKDEDKKLEEKKKQEEEKKKEEDKKKEEEKNHPGARAIAF
jgi:hypothetical protein